MGPRRPDFSAMLPLVPKTTTNLLNLYALFLNVWKHLRNCKIQHNDYPFNKISCIDTVLLLHRTFTQQCSSINPAWTGDEGVHISFCRNFLIIFCPADQSINRNILIPLSA